MWPGRCTEALQWSGYTPPAGIGVMGRKLRRFLTDESGATAIEYAIIAGGIATAIIATVYSIGPKLNSTFSSISTQLK